MKQQKLKNLWTLFSSMLYISAFTFGGGFVIVTFMKRKFVDELHWLEEHEMLDMTALAQSAPGPIAVNASILVGWKVAGLSGMLCAVLGTILPPMIILSLVSVFYRLFAENRYIALLLKGMQSGVAAIILDVSLRMGKNVLQGKNWIHTFIMITAFAATFFFHINVIAIILCAALIGTLMALSSRKESSRTSGMTGSANANLETKVSGSQAAAYHEANTSQTACTANPASVKTSVHIDSTQSSESEVSMSGRNFPDVNSGKAATPNGQAAGYKGGPL